ncbi:unnamed protein product [Sphagnum balticum]
MQEQFRHISAGKLPQTISVVIEGEGDAFRAGDDVTISGLLDYRFKKPIPDQKVQVQLILVANQVINQRTGLARENDRKSVLLQTAAALAERSFLTNGIGTSSAGLAVSYYKDGGDWTIEPGALVLADNGVCCID